ncbi:Na+/H+ antiporter subunit G [Paracoccus sp. R12_1]|uniref:Na+/H+ antiporter subunit G n=1 Tax=unclassified Paracoccus (in: a-proteobacteria) TaxID=2688777 RepID=UPI001ADAC992|nr:MULTISPECIES: Na+/H+ antiporter subunit G [unclassified Paracoccus (in: a-proteobacteria)]MBO9455024.1 Na+/H+ antiporter subunit G [Paracoccus sp. R12_2]MBO9485288.1 Na+/H+ antiporter subunit G [Paracoccus sp. R12_1]
MEYLAEILITALLVLGGIFGLVGSFGLVKLPDQMTRLHAPTKAATLGVGGVLMASLCWFFFFSDHSSWHELLITLFLFLTAPVTGLMIAKTNMHLTWRPEELPDPGEDRNWATFGQSADRSLMDAVPEVDKAARDHRE